MILRRYADRILIALFVLAVGLPGALALVRPADEATLAQENRRPAPMPSLHPKYLKKLPTGLEAFANDRLPFRAHWLAWQAELKIEHLGVSSSEKVILGRDGWLFLDETKARGGTHMPDADAQVRLWHRAFRQRHDWCAARGIRYLVVLAPEKHAIYPEYLPSARQHPQEPTAAERLLSVLRAEGIVETVNLREPLCAAKAECQVYYRTDTHWNCEGAFVAYRAILKALGLHWHERADFRSTPVLHIGDLNRMLHRPQPEPEPSALLDLQQVRARHLDLKFLLDDLVYSPRHLPAEVWGRGTGVGPRAVLFHDSFGERLLLPALPEHFDVLAYAPSASFDPQVVRQVQPTIVIQELVERKINGEPPIHPRGFPGD